MPSDQQQRQRADAIREQLKETIRQTLIAIQSTRDLVDECQRRRDAEEWAAWRDDAGAAALQPTPGFKL